MADTLDYVARNRAHRILRRSGFEIEDLIEVYPREGATTGYPFVSLEWSRAWPCEEVWKARKRG